MTESEKEYIGERVKCEFCENEYSKQNIKRHKNTCNKNPINKSNHLTDYEKGKEIHKPKQIGTPLKDLNKDLKRSQSLVKAVASVSNYEMIDKAMGKCPHCKGVYHVSGLPKHVKYCDKNINGEKNGYKTKRKWCCRHCNAIFELKKQRDLHESRCETSIEPNEHDNFDRLRDLKRLFPEIYKMLNSSDIQKFLDGEL